VWVLVRFFFEGNIVPRRPIKFSVLVAIARIPPLSHSHLARSYLVPPIKLPHP
jgi:hypothetical protein